MKNTLFLTTLIVIFTLFVCFPALLILRNALEAVQPIKIGDETSQVLTHTTLDQLHSSDLLGLLFSETTKNPYIYGWDENKLYYKDALNRDFVFELGQDKSQRTKVDNPQFLKQKQQYGECNPENSPAYANDYPFEVIEGCYSYKYGDIKIEAWQKELGSLLAYGIRYVVITKDGKQTIFDESRTLSDIVISENGEYAAFNISNPVNYPDFDATDIHVVKLP